MEHAILYTGFDQVLAARKAAADDALRRRMDDLPDPGDLLDPDDAAGDCTPTLGLTYATPPIFLTDAWDIWGDGRKLIGNRDRCLLLLDILADHPDLAHIAQNVRLFADFIERFAGESHFEDAVAAAQSVRIAGDETLGGDETLEGDFAALGDKEKELFGVIGEYYDRLNRNNFIEAGDAANKLSGVMPPQQVECAMWIDMSPAMRDLFETLNGSPCAEFMPQARVVPLEQTVETGFLFPAGPAATLPMIKDEIEAFCAHAKQSADHIDIAVGISDPFAAYEELAAAFVEEGYTCALRLSLPFAETMFGRAMDAALSVVSGDPHWAAAATDFAYNAFSGMSERDAQYLDTTLRGDRLITNVRACDILRESSDSFPLFEALLGDDALDHAQKLKDYVARLTNSSSSFSAAEPAAAGALCCLVENFEQLGIAQVSLQDAAHLLSVSASEQTDNNVADAPEDPSASIRIEFVSVGALDRLPMHEYDLVIVGDVSETTFKSAASHNVFGVLAEKIGIVEPNISLDAARETFACAERAARKRFTCVLPLRDQDREPAYPSFVFNEYASVLRKGDEEVDRECFDLPCRITGGVQRRGEDDIAACLGHAFTEPIETVHLQVPNRGELVELPLTQFLYMVASAENTPIPVLSPSALESYIDCPYHWFVDRRIRLSAIDEGFGPLEKGNFAHAVFADFFDTLASRGIKHLDEQNADELEMLLDEIFDERMREDADKPGERLAPVSASETLEVETLRANMHVSLLRQMKLPASFEVYANELVFDAEDNIDYAGSRMSGRIDRVDMDDEAKHFVVLDYKGNLTGYDAGFSDKDDIDSYQLPHKVQALIYAQALRHQLNDYACAGAIYLSYSAYNDRDFMAGSYNEAAYDVAHYAGDRSCVHMNFEAFLDLIEEQVSSYVQTLLQGNIRVAPRDKEACRNCGVSLCVRRM